MLDDFVAKLITGKYSIKSKGDIPDHTSEQGEYLKLILALDRSLNNLSDTSKNKYRLPEQSESTPQLCDIDGFNLPTHFGECEDLTHYKFDIDDFKYSDLFDENGEVHAETLWSTVDHGAMTVQGGLGCLTSVFDVYTVSIVPSGEFTFRLLRFRLLRSRRFKIKG